MRRERRTEDGRRGHERRGKRGEVRRVIRGEGGEERKGERAGVRIGHSRAEATASPQHLLSWLPLRPLMRVPTTESSYLPQRRNQHDGVADSWSDSWSVCVRAMPCMHVWVSLCVSVCVSVCLCVWSLCV